MDILFDPTLRERLTRLASDREPMERKDREWWAALYNAWFLCGILRTAGTPRPDARRAMLNTSIVWG